MTDLATLVVRVETIEARLATQNLDGLTEASKRTETATDRLANASRFATDAQKQHRMGVQQLGYQFNDFGTQVSTGISPIVAFNQQIGQVGWAMSQMQGKAGAVGAFLAGPWGAAITIGTALLGAFIGKMMEQNRALDEGVKKLKEDAAAADSARRAKETFAQSAEGVSEAIREMNEELEKSTRSSREAEIQALSSAQTNLKEVQGLREQIAARIELRKQLYLDALAVQGLSAAGGGDGAEPWTVRNARQGLAQAELALAKNALDQAKAANAIRLAGIPIAQRYAEEMSSAAGRINRTYDEQRDAAVAAARGNDQLNASLANTLLTLENRRQAELAANSEAERQGRRQPQMSETEREYERLIERSRDFVVQMQHEREELGLSETQLIRLNTSRRARELIQTGTAEAVAMAGQLVDEAERLIAAINSAEVQVLAPVPRVNLRPLTADQDFVVARTEILADHFREIDRIARRAGDGMADAFGRPGQALSDLMTNLTSYRAEMADIAADEARGTLDKTQAARARASAEMDAYGDMLSAARGYFAEGSDGYKALLVAEQVYRAFQFASAIQSMALGGQETAMDIANSVAKIGPRLAAGAAGMFEKLGPFGFPAVAAMLALMATLGFSSGGGGGRGGGRSAANDNDPNSATDAVRASDQRESKSREALTASVANSLEVRVTADRDGLNAYVVATARDQAAVVAAPMVAAAAAGTKRDVMQDLRGQHTGNRRNTV